MQEIKYANAGMDMKKLGLCFMKKIWFVLVAAAVGALFGGISYTVVRMTAEREYQAVSKIYLDFAADETGEVYQAYNGYTWNDLMAADPLLDVTMEYLPADYTREEVTAAVKAEILSDLRLLTLTITSSDAGRCNAILEAAEQSLVKHGQTAKEFRNITVIQSVPAKLVTADDRTVQAVLVGFTIVTVLTLFGMLFYDVLDDRILIAGDLKVVTDAVFAGYPGVAGVFGEDYEKNLAYLKEKFGEVEILSVTQPSGKTGTAPEPADTECGNTPDGTGSAYQKTVQDKESGVLVTVEYGKVHAAYLAYVLEQLKFKERRVAGIAISGADEKFLDRYYGRAFGRK